MIKKVFILLILVLLLNTVSFSMSSQDMYFVLPMNQDVNIVSRDGKIIMSGDVYLVRDFFSGKINYFGKKISEKSFDTRYEIWYSYHVKDCIYDLQGNLLLETKKINKINSVNNKILYTTTDGCYLFDVYDKSIEHYNAYTLLGNNIVFYNDHTIYIYDKNLCFIKSITGYHVEWERKYGNEKNLFLNTVDPNTGLWTSKYNFLDSTCNLLFTEDIEKFIEYFDDDSSLKKMLSNGKEFVFDLEKKTYIATISETSKLKNSIKKTSNAENDIDSNIQIIKDKIGDPEDVTAFVRSYEYNGKKIYIAHVHKTTTGEQYGKPKKIIGVAEWTADSYVNIYDANLQLLVKKMYGPEVSTPITEGLLRYGYIVIGSEVYDFDMNYVRTIESSIYKTLKINDRVYFLGERNEKSHYLYDINLNLKTIFKDCEIAYYAALNGIFVIKDQNSTKLYDENLNIIKDTKRKITIETYYTSEDIDYTGFVDDITGLKGVIDKKGNIVVDNLERIFRMGIDCCSYRNNNIVGVMDFNKNVILSISINDDEEAYKSE